MMRFRTEWLSFHGWVWCILAIAAGLITWMLKIDQAVYLYFQDWQAQHAFWGKFFAVLSYLGTAGWQQIFCTLLACIVAVKNRPNLAIKYGLFGIPIFYLGALWFFLRMLFGINWTKPLGAVGRGWYWLHMQVEAAPDHAKLWSRAMPLFLWIGIFVHIPKILIGRPRPFKFLTEGEYWAGWIDAASRMKSFPSGHAITTFALIAILWPHYNKPWQRIGMVMLGAFICWGRLSSAHWLGDILAAAGIGFIFGRFYAHKYGLDKLRV